VSRESKPTRSQSATGVIMAGELLFTQMPRSHDGMLDLYSLELQTLWKLALMFPIFQRGEHGNWDDVSIDHASWFDISTRRPQPVNADGEIVTQTPLRIEVLKKALRVFAA